MNKWRTFTIILLAAAGVLAFLYIDGCSKRKATQADIETLMDLHIRDSTELVEKTNELGQVTVTAEAFQLSQETLDKYVAENAALKDKFANEYKDVNSVNTSVTNFHVDTIKIPVPVHDTLPCGDIEREYPVKDKDGFYSFDFKFSNKEGHNPEFFFLNFNIPDTAITIIGVQKSGFLNMKRTLVSEQVHSNKMIQTLGVKTIVKSEAKPKKLRTLIIGVGLGVAGTIFLQNKLKQ